MTINSTILVISHTWLYCIFLYSLPLHITPTNLYRYIQLTIYIAKNSKSCDVLSLQRDSLLLQFLFGFMTTTPLIIVNLYQLLPDIIKGQVILAWPMFPILVSSLAVNILSLLLTLISYIANDRLHSEKRRVVYPGHMTALIWHVCMIIGRIMALSLFAVAFGPYITIIIGIHWIATITWTFFEKTNFCGDVTVTPPKKRFHLEIPFVLVISFVYLFLFFNIRDGSTMSRIVVFHALTSVETLVLAALFYAVLPGYPLSPWLFGFTVGFYIIGVAFMSLYYAGWHPSRTADCFLIGIPHSCDCCHVFYKLPMANITGNVDLPIEGAVHMGGHSYGIRDQGVVAVEDAGVTLTEYDPLANLTVLMKRQSSYTIGQISRSLTTTPTSTPQHKRGNPSVPKVSVTDSDRTVSQRNSHTNRLTLNGSHPNVGTSTLPLFERPSSVMESRPAPIGMGTRSLSEDTRVGPGLNNDSGIGQLAARKPRPASESIDVRSYTPTHQRYPTRKTWFQRTRSERYHRRPSILYKSENDITPGSHSTPLSRRSEDITATSDIIRCGPNRYSVSNHSGMVVLPSPIGEEPGTGLTRFEYQVTPPIILQVNDTSAEHSDRTVVAEPLYSVPYNKKTNNNSRWSEIHYTDFTPSRTSRNTYINTPIRTRQRSVSPVLMDGRRSSPISRSTNCSPYRRHRNPSHPLHMHDPMQEFTRLYSSNPSSYKDRLNEPPRVPSTSSSYLLSSDNHSDIDYATTDDETKPVNGGSDKQNVSSKAAHNHTSPLIDKTRLNQVKITACDQVKVTAFRQNSDEFLITKLHNINGTLV